MRSLRGLRVLTLALVRLALGEGRGAGAPLLEGGRGSAACTLDGLVQKADSVRWLRDVLEVEPGDSAGRRLQGWFRRQNSNLNDKGQPVRVHSGRGSGALGAGEVTVRLGAGLADRAALERLVGVLAEGLGETTARRVEIFGVLPCAGDGVRGRERELRRLHELVPGGDGCGVQVVGEAGVGKTALLARWLDELESGQRRPFCRIVVRSFRPIRPSRGTDRAGEASRRTEDPHRTLVVLDGLDALAEGEREEVVAEVPTGASVVVTSREALRDPGLPGVYLRLLDWAPVEVH